MHLLPKIVLMCSVFVVAGCASPDKLITLQESVKESQNVLQRNTDLIAKQHEMLMQMAAEQVELQRQVLSMQDTVESTQAVINTIEITADKPSKPGKKKRITATTIPNLANNETPLPQDKLTLGRNEWLWFDMFGRSVPAYLDTGRKTSLLAVKNLQRFERDGKDWVRFNLAQAQEEPESESSQFFEFPVRRMLSVRLLDSSVERRPVIGLKITLAGITEVAEFSLSEKDIEHAVVLGSNFLRDIAVVDVARSFTQPKYQPNE